MRDHPAHTAYIMGGMLGFVSKDVRPSFEPLIPLLRCIRSGDISPKYNDDQMFLAKYIYHQYLFSSCVHDPFYDLCPFPSAREGFGFVGQSFKDSNLAAMEAELEDVQKVLDGHLPGAALIAPLDNPIRAYFSMFRMFHKGKNMMLSAVGTGIEPTWVSRFRDDGFFDPFSIRI